MSTVDDTRLSTQDRILVAAAHLFARHGIEEVRLRDIAVLAGQRNSSAVQYHFGGRWDLVAGILERHDRTVRGWAPALDTLTLPQLVGGLVGLLRSELGTAEGRDFLRVTSDLMSRYPGRWDMDPTTHEGFSQLVDRITVLLSRGPHDLPPRVARIRAVAMAQFVSYQMAERSRLVDDRSPPLDRLNGGAPTGIDEGRKAGRTPSSLLPEPRFVGNLEAMATGLLVAPLPAAPPNPSTSAKPRKRATK